MKKIPRVLLEYARHLRREQTIAEQYLWQLLRNRSFGGFKFRRQKTLGSYIIDFYCSEKRLAIELDGGGHAEGTQVRHDYIREIYLKNNGIRVLRYWNNQLFDEPENVLEDIWNKLNSPPSS